MQLLPIGLVTVTTAGTPVALTADAFLLALRVRTIIVQPLDTNTGKIYFGKNAAYNNGAGQVNLNFSVASGVGVIKTFLVPTASGLNDWFMLPVGTGPANMYLVSEFQLDASINTQKAYVTLGLN